MFRVVYHWFAVANLVAYVVCVRVLFQHVVLQNHVVILTVCLLEGGGAVVMLALSADGWKCTRWHVVRIVLAECGPDVLDGIVCVVSVPD